jgi:hypothetical protein
VNGFGRETIGGEATGGTGAEGLGMESYHGRIEQGEDRQGGMLGAKCLYGAKSQQAPCVKIEGERIPRASRERTEGFCQGESALHVKRDGRRLNQGLREFQPGVILSQEQAPERLVGHRSF